MIQFLKSIGFDVIFFISGLAGGIASLDKRKALNRKQQFIIILSGGLTSNYLTPLMAEIFNLSDKTLFGMSFFIGYLGLKTVEAFIISYIKKITNEKENT